MFFDRFRKKNKKEEKISKFSELRNNVAKITKEKINQYINSGYTKEQLEPFINSININLSDLDRFIECYEKCEANLSSLDKDSEQYKKELENKNSWYYSLIECSKRVEFYRPNSITESHERDEIFKNFGNTVSNLLGPDSNLRFHGTSIYYAKDIIKSKTISGTADRYDGHIKSTDSKGTFSASDVSSLNRTVQFFMDLGSDRRCFPCGVLFVLNEKDNDYDLREASLMNNIDFNKNPEQLNAIISTDENIKSLTKWCLESNIDPSCIYTYDSYIEYIRNSKIVK